ncbi:tetraacyldisaccharide 4'-kinase [Calycomorphotria hydatis]|uniref:Tetraacyldisaccharide 4'-kinase n=1 Tax=Calycomorphotria hydatis TaxID=2528027 RepID=A0A517T5I8_9PLAN|nr:tetraacyldisaccharide 4'-kinase [Calycomorphotria hydatis]QDT63646.1 Tetraacyldisaccharide 4'-kinase [Calycomorphotria hydatis]
MWERFFIETISGRRQGIGYALLRAVLRWCTLPYALVVWERNRHYDRDIHRTLVQKPVISVGNLTTGGTGKTPVVAYLANWFRARGGRVGLLSRGYGNSTDDDSGNDEKRVLDQHCDGIPHWQDRNRVRIARRAISEGANVLVLDDGFQHRKLDRDIDLVLIDATNPWGFDSLLPRGLLREPVGSLKRAGIVAITRADQVDPFSLNAIEDRVRGINPSVTIVHIAFEVTGLINANGEQIEREQIGELTWAAFCGIGNPTGFERTLESIGCVPSSMTIFPDHHHFTGLSLARIVDAARVAGANAIICTEKDLVKIDRDQLAGLPLWAVRIEARVTQGEAELESLLTPLLPVPAYRRAA